MSDEVEAESEAEDDDGLNVMTLGATKPPLTDYVISHHIDNLVDELRQQQAFETTAPTSDDELKAPSVNEISQGEAVITLGVDNDFVVLGDASNPLLYYISDDENEQEHHTLIEHCLAESRLISWTRSLCFGVNSKVSDNEVRSLLARSKLRYAKLAKLAINVDVLKAISEISSIKDPLSIESEKIWQQIHQSNQMLKQINVDLPRTSGLRDSVTLINIARKVLLVWAVHHSSIGYVQGMNDIIAVIIVTLNDEHNVAKNDEFNDDSDCVRDSEKRLEKIEQHSFVIFEALLGFIAPFFAPEPEHTNQFYLHDVLLPSSSMLQHRLHRIYHQLLKAIDIQVYRALNREEIPAPIFLVRWFRALFRREFCSNQVAVLWDAIFNSPSLSLLNYVCVALILIIARRARNMTSSSHVLQSCFMKTPPLVNVHVLLRLARRLQSSLAPISKLDQHPLRPASDLD